MILKIDDYIVTGRTVTKRIVDEAYVEAYACAPGCTCENIMTEYTQIIKW